MVKRWHPQDFGFFPVYGKENAWQHGSYELRSFPNGMWLLRRKSKAGTAVKLMVKFYYYIEDTDVEFAQWLLQKRLTKNEKG